MSPRRPRGADFWRVGGHFGILFRALFETTYLAGFEVNCCNLGAAVGVGSAVEAEPAEGGEASASEDIAIVQISISLLIQHALLTSDEVRRIYAAFGEHPAAGVCIRL
jgi:hypothetical protein